MEPINLSQELTPQLAAFAVLGYLLGSIPFGLLLTKWAGLGDIRKTGSGNIGATNVLRTGNKGIAVLTLLLDMAKAAVAVTLAILLTDPAYNAQGRMVPNLTAYCAGLTALLGHMYPVWLHGKGGKGVASYLGILLSLSWQTFMISAINWLAIFFLKRISSLAALFTALFAPIWLYIFTDARGFVFGLAYSLLVIYRHRENIIRLRRGEEKPFRRKEDEAV